MLVKALAEPVQQAQFAYAAIGAALKNHSNFRTDNIAEVLAYLRTIYAITSELFEDIGANICAHLAHAQTACSVPRGLAFEPDPHNFALQVKNIAANNLQGSARAFKLTVSSRQSGQHFWAVRLKLWRPPRACSQLLRCLQTARQQRHIVQPRVTHAP